MTRNHHRSTSQYRMGLWGKKLRHTDGQVSQAPANTPEGKTPLGIAHGHPPYASNLYTPGSIIFEQALIGPKTLVNACQVWRPVLDESTGTDIDQWQDLGNIHTGDRSGHLFLKRQLCSRGENNSSYRVQTASRLSPQKYFPFPLFPLCYRHHRSPSNAT